MKTRHFLLVVFLILTSLNICFTQWSTDPAENTPICTAREDKSISEIISDGQGGAIIVWTDWQLYWNPPVHYQFSDIYATLKIKNDRCRF